MTRAMSNLKMGAVLLLLLLAIGALAYVTQGGARHTDLRTNHAIDSYNRWGTRGLGELLTRQGLDVHSFRQRLTRLGPQHRTLVILSPSRHFTSGEVTHLLKWVETGGMLLIAPSRQQASEASQSCGPTGCGIPVPEILPPVQQLLGPMGLRVRREADLAGTAQTTAKAALLAEVAEVYVPSHLRLELADANALAKAYPEAARSEHVKRYLQPVLQPRQVRTLVSMDNAGVVMEVLHGEGRILVLAEADMLGNHWIAQADNAVLATNFAHLRGAATICFDEYHHGTSLVSIEGQEALASEPWRVLLLGLAAIGLFFAGKMVRFGAPVPLRTDVRRCTRESLQALAQLFMQANASAFALETITTALKKTLAQCGRTSVQPVSAPHENERLARRCAERHSSLDAASISAILNELDLAVQSGRSLTRAEFVRLSQAAAAIERKVHTVAHTSTRPTNKEPFNSGTGQRGHQTTRPTD
jgi:hypothetical protein